MTSHSACLYALTDQGKSSCLLSEGAAPLTKQVFLVTPGLSNATQTSGEWADWSLIQRVPRADVFCQSLIERLMN